MHKPVLYNQNSYMNGENETKSNSSKFLPDITNSEGRKNSKMVDFNRERTPKKYNYSQDMNGQISYANEVFKDAAILQNKLQNSAIANDGLRKELF